MTKAELDALIKRATEGGNVAKMSLAEHLLATEISRRVAATGKSPRDVLKDMDDDDVAECGRIAEMASARIAEVASPTARAIEPTVTTHGHPADKAAASLQLGWTRAATVSESQADLTLLKAAVVAKEAELRQGRARNCGHEEERELHQAVVAAEAAYQAARSGGTPLRKQEDDDLAEAGGSVQSSVVSMSGIPVPAVGGGYMARLTARAQLVKAEEKLASLKAIADRRRSEATMAPSRRAAATTHCDTEELKMMEQAAATAEKRFVEQRDVVAKLRAALG